MKIQLWVDFRAPFFGSPAGETVVLSASCQGPIVTSFREPKWTESIAVGSEGFVTKLEGQARNRQNMEVVLEAQTWVLRERYESVFEAKNRPIPTF